METTDIANLQASVDQLAQCCERLSRENAELRRRLDAASAREPSPRPALNSPEPSPVSRRGMLGTALSAAAAGAAGTTLLGAAPAAATDGDAVMAGVVTLAEHSTHVKYDGAGNFRSVVLLGNDSTYDSASASFPAALGGWTGAGAHAGAGGVPNGIYGYSEYGAGYAVVGSHSPTDGGAGGAALYGVSSATTSGATASLGEISSTNPGDSSAGVRGVNHATNNNGFGVHGSHAGGGAGVYGTAGTGRGGVFSGPKAAVQLRPTTATTHPSSGSRGDLYVDRSARLWFCKKGGSQATWTQLA